jgi:hypothetical protein
MKLNDVLLEKSSYYKPHYQPDAKVVGGSAEDWQKLIGITKENRDEMTKKAFAELKKTATYKEATDLGLKFISTDRELQLGTLAIESSVTTGDVHKKWHSSASRWSKEIYVYNIYGSGQIRQYSRPKDKPSVRAGITRLASPKPKVVVNNPSKSLATTWENALKEVNKKYKAKLAKIEKE